MKNRDHGQTDRTTYRLSGITHHGDETINITGEAVTIGGDTGISAAIRSAKRAAREAADHTDANVHLHNSGTGFINIAGQAVRIGDADAGVELRNTGGGFININGQAVGIGGYDTNARDLMPEPEPEAGQ